MSGEGAVGATLGRQSWAVWMTEQWVPDELQRTFLWVLDVLENVPLGVGCVKRTFFSSAGGVTQFSCTDIRSSHIQENITHGN